MQKHLKSKTICFSIILGVISLIYALVILLSRNTLMGWIIFAMLVAGFAIIRHNLKKRDRWNTGKMLTFWVILLVLFAINYRITMPPYRAVPAIDGPAGGETAPVSTAYGELTGVFTSDKEVEVYAGIPYAKPPVGDLRFREPQPCEPWEGVRRCDEFAPMAMQKRSSELMYSIFDIFGTHDFHPSIIGNSRDPLSEDCLYLNIWKPAGNPSEPLPVLVYIHGGGLEKGCSYDEEYRGQSMASHGVIMVTIAYRLGAFGYFASEQLAAESPNGTTGNYGLLDQIAALKWVNDNISSFGGDPKRITIAGESAGSSSVNALCVSPLAKGLFTYAIAESSGILAKHPYHTFRDMDKALLTGSDIMKELGVSTPDELRAVPAEKFLKYMHENDKMTVDGYAITEQPYLTYERGANNETALLNGFNEKDGDKFVSTRKVTSENYLEALRYLVGDYADEMAKLVPAGSVKRDQAYFTDKGGDAKGSFDVVSTAAYFTYSHHVWSNYMVGMGRPVYEYCFTKTNDHNSDYHVGELPYAYGNLDTVGRYYSPEDHKLSDIMQSYWANFVKTGDPNGVSSTGDPLPKWDARDSSGEKVLELGEKVQMIDDPFIDLYPVIDKYMDSVVNDTGK